MSTNEIPGLPNLAHGFWLVLLTLVVGILLYHLVFKPVRRHLRFRRAAPYCPSFLLPPLPQELDKVRTIPSLKQGGVVYEVNLHQLTCTCPQFRHRRGFYPKGDVRRLCRHVRKELRLANALVHYDELTRRIIEGRGKDHCYARLNILGSDIAFGFHPRNDFARIFTRRQMPEDPPEGPFTGPYDKFTFLISQEIWVYGEEPPGAETIVAELKKTLETYCSRHPGHTAPEDS